jgi:hypothetical protein
MYVHRATRVVLEESKPDDKKEGEVEGEGEELEEDDATKTIDPMENDVFDSDEAQNRRCEAIETTSFGSVYARCLGDPADPLILYIHGGNSSQRGRDSKMWNGLVSSFANEMTAAEEEAAQAAKEAAAREHQEMLDRYRNSGPTTGGSSTKRKPTQPKRKAKKEASKDAKKDVKKEEAQV